ncbi:hypothetical protein TI39_contig369g00015 [Zymoseptoria brevis]|uniref:Uncharacterized protein n=1 Tax=Zymoseptoria brevis TaxID=1047168 RepID=A0A0F4GP32_9PEZI|nr:hypothetical protein TI39_contig369g00015 [Zymoseptoria brevis]
MATTTSQQHVHSFLTHNHVAPALKVTLKPPKHDVVTILNFHQDNEDRSFYFLKTSPSDSAQYNHAPQRHTYLPVQNRTLSHAAMHLLSFFSLLLLTTTSACYSRCVCQDQYGNDVCEGIFDWDCSYWCY